MDMHVSGLFRPMALQSPGNMMDLCEDLSDAKSTDISYGPTHSPKPFSIRCPITHSRCHLVRFYRPFALSMGFFVCS